jgi:hypothetical protein
MVLVDYEQYKPQTFYNTASTDKSRTTRELDAKIHEILQNDELSDHDKCNLYMETLRKYLHFMHQDLKNKEEKTLNLNNNFKNLFSKFSSEVSVKPVVKRLSKGPTPLKIKQRSEISPYSTSRKISSRIPKLKKVPLPIIENWVSIKSEPGDE